MNDVETIKRIALMVGLSISERDGVVFISSRNDRAPAFNWNSQQDLGDFVQELLAYQYDVGYDAGFSAGSRW